MQRQLLCRRFSLSFGQRDGKIPAKNGKNQIIYNLFEKLTNNFPLSGKKSLTLRICKYKIN